MKRAENNKEATHRSTRRNHHDKEALNALYDRLADAINANDFTRRNELFSQICDIVNKR